MTGVTGEINWVKIFDVHDNHLHISDKSVKVLAKTLLIGLVLVIIAFICWRMFFFQEKPVNEAISLEVPQQKIEEVKISQMKADVVSQSKPVEENKPEPDKVIVPQEIKAAATISQEPAKSSSTTTKASKTYQKKKTNTVETSTSSATAQKSDVKADVSQSAAETFYSPGRIKRIDHPAYEVIP